MHVSNTAQDAIYNVALKALIRGSFLLACKQGRNERAKSPSAMQKLRRECPQMSILSKNLQLLTPVCDVHLSLAHPRQYSGCTQGYGNVCDERFFFSQDDA